jgi:hypothetical protein
MEDRMGSRSVLAQQLLWAEPEAGGDPEWRAWRNALPSSDEFEAQPDQELCRSMSGLVVWKPSDPN